MDITKLIYELIQYGKTSGLIDNDDVVYTTNKLLEFFKVEDYSEPEETAGIRDLHLILEDMILYAKEAELLAADTITGYDLFDTAVMGLITPPPSVVRAKFKALLDQNPILATDYYYSFSKATNYIRTDRIEKDEKWVTKTEFGDLDITINLSKPEKDPRDIADAGKAKKSGYPACLLCMENEGYAGSMSHPARQNHRIIPIVLNGENYFLQYSPYVYYNEHCIILNEQHVPMKIDRQTFKKLLDFVTLFPHYTAGSNADLPIVGGSILSHDHFQGGGYEFPMVRAPYEYEFTAKGYEDIRSGIIKWPMSTIRLQSVNSDRVALLAGHILDSWRTYTDESAFIYSMTDGTPHNTITPIARMRHLNDGSCVYELDLVLRNNITTDEHPLGVFHPHSEYHHIKKENIGLIEVMGLAVLPSRLKNEMKLLEDALLDNMDIHTINEISSHADWADMIRHKYSDFFDNKSLSLAQKKDNLHKVIRDEIGLVFSGVLEDAGVYKRTPEGKQAFLRFIDNL
ncbi:MAG: UDP-glucose--hexose-1-phosphate uridylyltransferase [Eubacterium sp.]|nr:UDP-glucose--hexose-1-phosphate uridylyltransferase [Eubacterium sp.]